MDEARKNERRGCNFVNAKRGEKHSSTFRKNQLSFDTYYPKIIRRYISGTGIKMCELMVIWCRCSKLCGVMQYSRFYKEREQFPYWRHEKTHMWRDPKNFSWTEFAFIMGVIKSSRNQYWIVRRLLSGGWWRQALCVIIHHPRTYKGIFSSV